MLKKFSELDVQMCNNVVDYVDEVCGAVRVRDKINDKFVFPIHIYKDVTEADVKAGGGFLDMFNAFANAFYDGDVTKFRHSFWEHTGVHMCKGDLLPSITMNCNCYRWGLPENLFERLLFARIIEMCRKLKFLLRGARWSNKCLQKKLDECYARLEDKKELIDKQNKVNAHAQDQLAKHIINLEAENNRLRDLLFHVETNGLGLNWFNAFSRFKKLQAEVEQLKSKLR